LKEKELLAFLRLQKTPSIGAILAKRLIASVGNAQDIFKENKKSLLKINGIGSNAITNLFDDSNQRIAEQELHYITKNKIGYSCFLEDDFPQYLQHCIDAPILFFKKGTIDFSNERIISVVGTRKMTSYGQDFCQSLLQDLSVYNPVIVSGFAFGVDICAHQAAMNNHLQTIAVLAHGFDQIYPKAHQKYLDKVKENGGFVTEFFHDEDPLRVNFLKRNRIVAGISKATIIIESPSKGGSLVTADIANSYDKDVFAVPGRTNDEMSQGCNHLIRRNQAHLLQSSEDLVKMLNWDLIEIPKPQHSKQYLDLTENEQKIVDFLNTNTHQMIDIIALNTNIPVGQLATILLQLELKNMVKPLPGKIFTLT